MKRKVLIVALASVLVTTAGAAPLVVTNVGSPAINCIFNTNCLATGTDSTSPIAIPNATGTGSLQTRTITGETGSLAAGLTAYLYRIDLTGVTATNGRPPCVTNEVRCSTNRVITFTNRLVCHTNQFPASNRVVCVTNRVPATNIVFRFTNSIPATNFVRCTTNDAGVSMCVSNFFPGTNIITSFTNRIPASNIVDCTTVSFPATNVTVCASNRVPVTNIVERCTTNSVACPGSAPCVDVLTLRFGAPVGLDFTGGGSNAQVFVVTSGGDGTIAPSSVEQSNGIVTIRFEDGVCPGESSFFIGLVASNSPVTSLVSVELTSGSNVLVSARTPRVGGVPINCDFGPLRDALENMELSDILAPNDNARRGRLGSLLNNVRAAERAAAEGDLMGVLDALETIAKKSGNRRNSWIAEPTAREIQDILDTLLDCIEPHAAR